MTFSVRSIGDTKKKDNKKIKNIPWKGIFGIALMLARPLWELGKKIDERRRKALMLKRVLAISAAGAVSLAMIGAALALSVKIGMISMPTLIERAGEPVTIDEHGFTNILLLGQGNEDHDGIDLTDTIIVASIDPTKTKSAVLLSLPRDLVFLHTEKMGDRRKLNEMWRDYRIDLTRGGLSREEASLESLRQLQKEIGTALNLPIHYAIKVDFTAFEEAVNLLGGIDITVPEEINDTEYPGPNYSYQTFHIAAGFQHLDGATALKYARTRHTTSDFDRSARQQQIIKAAAERAREEGLLKKPQQLVEMLAIYSEHVETTLTSRQLITLAQMGQQLNMQNLVTLQLNNVNGLYGDQLYKGGLLYSPPRDEFNGASVLLPVSYPEFPVTWKQITTLSELLFRNRDLYLAAPKITVFNGGTASGIASKLGDEFTKFGFDVIEVTNVPDMKKNKVPASSVIFFNSDKRAAAAFFATSLGMNLEDATAPIAARLQEEKTGDFAVVLGENYRFKMFQDLVKTD